MIVYSCVFIFSLLFFYLSTKAQNRVATNLYIAIAVSIPVIIGGCRDKSVGTDTTFYAEIVFKDAVRSHNMKNYIEYTAQAAPRAEPGYAIVNYIVSRFTNSLNWCLLVIQGITFFFLVKAIRISRYKKYIVPSMFIFFCYFYNNSLNLIRQMLATTCFLYAYILYENKKKVKFTMVMCVDFFLHKTSLFGALIVIANNYFSRLNHKMKWPVYSLIYILLFCFLYRLDDVIVALSTVDAFAEYGAYTSEYQSTSSNYSEIIVRVFLVGLIIYAHCKKAISTYERDSYLFLLSIEIFFFFTSLYSQYLYRLGFYATALEIFYIPYVLNRFKNLQTRRLLKMAVYSLILFEWYWLHIDHGIGATVNYSSKVLGIN